MLSAEIFNELTYFKNYNFLYCLYLESHFENFGYLLKCYFLRDLESFLLAEGIPLVNIPCLSTIEGMTAEFEIISRYFSYIEKETMTPSRYFNQIGFDRKDSAMLTKKVIKMKKIIKDEKWSKN